MVMDVNRVGDASAGSDARFRPRRPPSWFVSRPRLVSAVAAATTHRVTSIGAPAGYGKSLLLAEWAATARADSLVTWLRLDASDNDEHRFLRAVASALRHAGATAPAAPPPALPLPDDPLPAGGLVDVLGELLHAATDGGRPVHLVLDDAHLLTDGRVLHALDHLLEFGPDPVHLVLAHRGEPRLRLTRRRLAGELASIGVDDLALTADETARLLAARQVPLDSDGLAALQAATGGWAAAVALAALWLGGPSRTATDLPAALASGAVTGDYLRHEVLSGLPAERVAALARLSVVDELTTDLATVLTADLTAPAGHVGRASREGLLLFPVDPAGQRYRWHPLAAAPLRRELAEGEPGAVADLHRRAAEWYSGRGEIWSAIRHAGQTGDHRFLAGLIASHWLEVAMSDRRREAADALDTVPPRLLSDYPELSLVRAAVHLADDAPSAALPLAEDALVHLPQASAAQRPAVAAIASGMRLYCWELGPAPDEVRDEALAAAHGTALDTASVALRAAARRFLDVALTASDWRGGARTSLAGMRRAAGDPAPGHTLVDPVDAHARLSLLTCYTGALDSAADQAREALDAGPPRGGGLAELALAWVQFLRGDGDAARERCERALEVLSRGDVAARCRALRLSALLHLDVGATGEARTVLRRAYDLGATAPLSPTVVEMLMTTEADLLLAEGDHPEALRVAAQAARPGSAMTYRPAFVVAADAQVRIADPRAALRRLSPTQGRGTLAVAAEISVLALRAVAERTLGRLQAAGTSLAAAVRLAAPQRIARPLLDNHDQLYLPIAELANSSLPEAAFLRQLVARGQARPPAPTPTAWLPQPLTQRERDILRHLRSRLSLSEIAGMLSLSPNTVKTHVKHVYEKLQVTGRQDAVRRAAELNLL